MDQNKKAVQEINKIQEMDKHAESMIVFMDNLGVNLSEAAALLEITGRKLQNKIKAVMDRTSLIER